MRLGPAVAGIASYIAAAAGAARVPFVRARRSTFAPDEAWLPFDNTQSVGELELVGYRARADLQPWPITIPVDWAADPFGDDNWQFLFHGWGMTDPHFARYRKRGRSVDLRKAADYAADWARYHYEEGREARYSWFDMSAGFRAVRTAFLLDRIATGELRVSGETEARLRRLGEDHARRLQIEDDIALNNHGLFQLLGLRMLCAVHGDNGAKAVKAFSNRKMREVLRRSYTRCGVHREHSPFYAIRVTSWLERPAFLRWWPTMIPGRVAKAKPLAPWYVMPNGDVAAIGDSHGQHRSQTAIEAEPTFLADGRCFAVKDLTADGYAIIRSPPDTAPASSSMLFVTGAADSLTHKHVDDLSFILFEGGQHIFVDTGMAGYTRDLRRRYVLGASAHNTISLADSHIEPKHVRVGGTTLSPIRIAGSAFVVEGSVDRGTLFRQKRTLTYDPERSLTIRDKLSGQHRRHYVSSLHLAPDLTPVIDTRGFTVDLGAGRVLRARIEETDCTISTARGQEDPLLGWVARGGKLVPTSVVRALCSGIARTITWHIDLGGNHG